jgi:hypothetical protein
VVRCLFIKAFRSTDGFSTIWRNILKRFQKDCNAFKNRWYICTCVVSFSKHVLLVVFTHVWVSTSLQMIIITYKWYIICLKSKSMFVLNLIYSIFRLHVTSSPPCWKTITKDLSLALLFMVPTWPPCLCLWILLGMIANQELLFSVNRVRINHTITNNYVFIKICYDLYYKLFKV